MTSSCELVSLIPRRTVIAVYSTCHCICTCRALLCIVVHWYHYSDVIMNTMTSQISSLTIVYSTGYSGADQRKHQNPASLAFVRWIHRLPMNSPHKRPVTRKMFPFGHSDINMLMQWKWMMMSSNGNIVRVTGLLWGEPPVIGGFPSQRPVTGIFDVFFHLGLNKRLSKQTRRRWFEKTLECLSHPPYI